jgi:prepilin-type N-terminal cleavage/methylation domain-containing protein
MVCHNAKTFRASSSNRHAGFTLIEIVIALAIVAVGFLGSLAAVAQAGKLASAAEEDALAASGLEQRIDQLRLLEWPDLTSTTGVKAAVCSARPTAMTGIAVSQETITLSGFDVPAAKTLQTTWNGTSAPVASIGAGGADLNTVKALKVVATITWTGRRSNRPQTRSAVTVISRGGISKSDLP